MQGERFSDLAHKNSWGLGHQGADREKISPKLGNNILGQPTEVGCMIDQQIMGNMMN
jgi:hypothetical protein